MKLPTAGRIATEAATVIGGAILAAVIIGHLPGLRAWIAAQWGDAKQNGS